MKCLNCKTSIRKRTREEMPQCEWKLTAAKWDKIIAKGTWCECGRCLIGWM